ncbi:phosphoribosylglycinamide formyltransferase [Thiopseudomonas denitrificans]|uniref:Phosphoribosylglycinamide formyltransferase n=1 Tax=Thiopseudomonas denitrificans TaxID=1501432 RepID=A0A4V3D4H0_9GAMM|nr:phosphoribosylglycinamide formyltransferase [Thiopseudomonas denitrificans]TDQ36157.1 formyltetrahydrofolate-dependent phosphoribosylglycinamide formyltransferase [Thiopseudomonas denitrificans]
MPAKSIVVLISGSGSNLQALLDHFADQPERARISAVISNRADAYGLERAKAAGVPAHVLSHRDYPDRPSFDRALAEVINRYQPDLVVLAGFMRILTPEFTDRYIGRLFNIHPSLLPKYKGLDTHQRALDAGDTEHGCSVHFVTSELDGGPVIIQARTPILPGDSAENLAQRVHQLEHRIYPLAAQWFVDGRLQLEAGTVVLDGTVLPSGGQPFSSTPPD